MQAPMAEVMALDVLMVRTTGEELATEESHEANGVVVMVKAWMAAGLKVAQAAAEMVAVAV